MSEYRARINAGSNGSFYAIAVRIEDDGHYASRKIAERLKSKYIAEYCQ